MSKTKQAIHRHMQVTGREFYGGPPQGWTPERKEKMSRFVVEQKDGYISVSQGPGSRHSYYLTKEEALSLSFQLEAHVQDMEEQELGVCPRCKDAMEEMDGSPCMLCEENKESRPMLPSELARAKYVAERQAKKE